MKKFLKWGLLIFVGLIVLGVIASAGKSGTNSTPNTNQAQEPTKAVEATKISVTELADDFDGNQVAAEKKWGGKFVEFSAEITNITDSGLSFSKVASKEFSMTQISCGIKDKNQLLTLKNGETTTVRGVVGKQTIGVIDLSDCEVVK
jgi:hypothetical protein